MSGPVYAAEFWKEWFLKETRRQEIAKASLRQEASSAASGTPRAPATSLNSARAYPTRQSDRPPYRRDTNVSNDSPSGPATSIRKQYGHENASFLSRHVSERSPHTAPGGQGLPRMAEKERLTGADLDVDTSREEVSVATLTSGTELPHLSISCNNPRPVLITSMPRPHQQLDHHYQHPPSIQTPQQHYLPHQVHHVAWGWKELPSMQTDGAGLARRYGIALGYCESIRPVHAKIKRRIWHQPQREL